MGDTVYAFQGYPCALNPLPHPLIAAVTVDPSNGNTSVVVDLNTDVGPIFGTAPVPSVPEPASIALFGTGLAALAARLHKSRRKTERSSFNVGH